MKLTQTIRSWADRTLVRGERGIAVIGLTMAAMWIGCFAVWAVSTERTLRHNAQAHDARAIQAAGALLARHVQELIASGDTTALRRTIIETADVMNLQSCSATLGDGRIIADRHPARINVAAVPETWADAASTTVADAAQTFPFDIPGRGRGQVILTGGTGGAVYTADWTAPGITCALALVATGIAYRNSRRRLAEAESIRGALIDRRRGETASAALRVNAALGDAAVAWNALLDEQDALQGKIRQAGTAAANTVRRAGGHNLESACDAMSQGIVLIDDRMCVRYANGAACSFLKLERDTIIGRPAAGLTEDEQCRAALSNLSTGKFRRPAFFELEQTTGDGPSTLRVCVRPVRRSDNAAAMLIIDDITQQRTAERARNTFINQVTHELRTPLTNIRLYAETAIEDGESNAEVRGNCLNVINQESRRLERIVSEMLSVAEMEAGCTILHRDEVYADVLLKDLLNDYQSQATEKQIALSFNVAPKLPKISADKDKLAIALHNLVGNALKYTPSGGKVVVSADVRDGMLAVDVADTGIGIQPAECEKVFDRFYRSGDPRVGKIVGTGLGLTLAREVMRLHGGDIAVQSQIDRGSTFTATLPLAAAA